MKKLFILSTILLSFTLNAQFLGDKPPSETEVKIDTTQQIPALIKLAAQAKKDKKYQDLVKIMEKILKLDANNPLFRFQTAQAYALADEKSKAFNALIALQKQGLYFDIENNKSFENIKQYPVFNYIKENFDASKKHFGKSEFVFSIDKSFSGMLFESLAFDQKNMAFFMGSLRDGSVIRINEKGKIDVFIKATQSGEDGPWAAIDLAVDTNNNVLWVASSAVSQYAKVSDKIAGKSGLFKYDLSTGKLLKSYLMPKNARPTLITAMHLTQSGDIYFIDSVKSLVLKLAKDADEITVVFNAKGFKNLRNITGDETGDFLYLSDTNVGIISLNLKNQKVFVMDSKPDLLLIGITDLIYDDKGLIILQSGFQPERIMRLQLADDKVSIQHVFPIETANADFDSLSYGAIVGDGLFYIANSQSAHANIFGGLLKNKQWQDMKIYSTAKHYNEKEALDYQQKIDELKKKAGK